MTYEEAYEVAFKEKKQNLISKQASFEKSIENLMFSDETYRKVTVELSQIGAQTAITALSGNTNKLTELEKKSKELNLVKLAILEKNDIKPVEFECNKCKDTGYLGGKICDCIKDKANSIYLESVAKEIPINTCRFENFDLNYYSDEQENGTTAKKRMTAILKFIKEYVICFSPEKSENLLFFGNTGLGKTHLSLAMVYELLKKGYNVYYESAFNLFTKIEKEHFSNNNKNTYERALNCDLLIIDDLGSEFVTQFVQTVIYNIINTRILANKPTVINTNLSMKEIETRYTPRVSSRLMGEFTAKKFLGNDIRQIKKSQK